MPIGRKIHIAMIATNLELNGISSVIMNYCCNIDLRHFNIVLFVGHNVALVHKEKCKKLGIEICELAHRKKETVKYYRELYQGLGRQHFDIAHVHGSNSAIAIELFIAALCGVKVRIAHSHNTTCMNMKVHIMLKPFFNRIYTKGFACGYRAGEWLFGNKKFVVIPNGFDVSKFRYDLKERKRMRNELGIENKFVIGHIGRFNEQKNQSYILEIFKYVAEWIDNAVLLLVGTGVLFEKIAEKVKMHPYRDRVIMYGETNIIEEMYMAMDVFVFPSKFEGFPITLLEAQISGLPCVISDLITEEAILNDNVYRLSIYEKPCIWAEFINKLSVEGRELVYEKILNIITKYEIKNTVKILENEYYEMIKDKE